MTGPTTDQQPQEGVGRPAEAVIGLSQRDLMDLALLIRRLEEATTDGSLFIHPLHLLWMLSTIERIMEHVQHAPFSGCVPAWIFPG